VTKSSNHTLSLHILASNSCSTINFPYLFPTDSILVLYYIPTLFVLPCHNFSTPNSNSLISVVLHWIPILWVHRNSTASRDFSMSLTNLRYWPRRKHLMYYCNVCSARCVETGTARTTENTAFPIVACSLPRDVFTCSLPSSGCPIVGCMLVGACLPSDGVSWLHSLTL
jgi:hypothetical protein